MTTHASPSTLHRISTRAASLTLLLALLPASCGLFTSRHTPEVVSGSYNGPALTIDRSGPSPVLVTEAPTGGYTLTVDRVLENVRSHDVFATIRTPDPRFVHTQAFVQLRALIPLPQNEPIRLCARVLPAGEKADSDDYPVALPLDNPPTPTPTPAAK